MRIAVMGVGNMGGGIAHRLLSHGHQVVVWDLSRERMAAIGEQGAMLAESARAAVRDADVVMTSLLGDASVEQSALSDTGFIRAMKPGAIHLCVTTISPDCAERLASAHDREGTRFVAGPVAGRPDSAAAGQLVTYLAGEPSAIGVVVDLAKAYTSRIVVLEGRAGLANVMKLCVNYMAISLIEMMGELYAFAEKTGLDRTMLRDYFTEVFNRPALKMYAAKLYENNISGENGFALVTGLKDVNLMLDTANACGVNLEVGSIAKRKMLKAIDLGLSVADWSAISQVTRVESGISVALNVSQPNG